MRIKKTYIIFVSIVLLTFLGCEVFFPQPEEIAKPENSGNIISLFNQKDTLIVWGKVNLKINSEFNKNKFINGTVYLDKTYILDFIDINNIWINSEMYSDSIYNLRIFINTKSPVHSIGNREYTYTFTDSIVIPIFISNYTPEPLKINSVEVDNVC